MQADLQPAERLTSEHIEQLIGEGALLLSSSEADTARPAFPELGEGRGEAASEVQVRSLRKRLFCSGIDGDGGGGGRRGEEGNRCEQQEAMQSLQHLGEVEEAGQGSSGGEMGESTELPHARRGSCELKRRRRDRLQATRRREKRADGKETASWRRRRRVLQASCDEVKRTPAGVDEKKGGRFAAAPRPRARNQLLPAGRTIRVSGEKGASCRGKRAQDDLLLLICRSPLGRIVKRLNLEESRI